MYAVSSNLSLRLIPKKLMSSYTVEEDVNIFENVRMSWINMFFKACLCSHFDFFGVALSMWIPRCWGIFHNWPDVGSINHLLDLSTAHGSGKEGTCWVSFLHDCINMCIKGQLGVYVNIKIFRTINLFQDVFIDMIFTNDGFYTISSLILHVHRAWHSPSLIVHQRKVS